MRKRARGATLDEIESSYRARLPEFRRVAAAIVGDRELALDAVQEGFALAASSRALADGALPFLHRLHLRRAIPVAARHPYAPAYLLGSPSAPR